MKTRALFMLGLLLTILACASLRKQEKLPVSLSAENIFYGDSLQKLQLYYSGAAGFYLNYQDQVVLHDPFLTRIPLGKQFGSYKNDSLQIATFLARTQLSRQQAPKLILGGHTHHDHMYDTPYLFYQLASERGPYFWGTESMRNIMAHWDPISFVERQNLIQSFSKVYQSGQSDTNLPWYYLPDSSIRVLPIQSTHAPHLCCGIQFFKGQPKLKKPESLARASSWQACDALAYVLDFMGEGHETDLRIYLQSSSPDAGMGMPPNALRDFDIVILTAASYQHVEDHPENLINALKPNLIVISHWEDIFAPLEEVEAGPKPLFSSDIGDFVERVRRAVRINETEEDTLLWVMPNPGVWINYKFWDERSAKQESGPNWLSTEPRESKTKIS